MKNMAGRIAAGNEKVGAIKKPAWPVLFLCTVAVDGFAYLFQ